MRSLADKEDLVLPVPDDYNVDREMDKVMNRVDDLLLAGKFTEVDQILRELDVDKVPALSILITYLMLAKSARAHLPFQPEFARKVEARFQAVAPDRWEELMDGLR